MATKFQEDPKKQNIIDKKFEAVVKRQFESIEFKEQLEDLRKSIAEGESKRKEKLKQEEEKKKNSTMSLL